MQPLSQILDDRRAWDRSGAADSAVWTYRLSSDCTAALGQMAHQLERTPLPLEGISLGDFELESLVRWLAPVRQALEEGHGFALLDRLELGCYTPATAQALYWAIGLALGQPRAQNIEGDLLYDVRDTGRDVRQGARFSVTNAASSFHVDSAFSPQLPDYVGLLCRQIAKGGGTSQLISAYTLHNRLLRDCPEVLEGLYDTFCFDRRGQFGPGESSVFRAPIFHWDGTELTMRYLRYYIEVGHQRAEQSLSGVQKRALSAVEDLLASEDLAVEFAMAPGQMLFTNNHWILHNRTAFEDYPQAERRRHYVRLWLGRRDG